MKCRLNSPFGKKCLTRFIYSLAISALLGYKGRSRGLSHKTFVLVLALPCRDFFGHFLLVSRDPNNADLKKAGQSIL